MTAPADKDTHWNTILRLGGIAALLAVLFGILEIAITFLPGGNTSQETIVEWFSLFQANPFMGLRNLGLLNILINSMAILTFFAFYAAHHRSAYKPYALLVMIIAYLGLGVFYATNRAFVMLDLSSQYALATSDAQRAALEAAGISMLNVGQSHSAGTFFGFFLLEIAGVLISLVMLRSGIFSKTAAVAGLLGFGLLLVFEVFSSFFIGLNTISILLAGLGGILSMIWYFLIARTFFQLARGLGGE
jgi:hypothetical protein